MMHSVADMQGLNFLTKQILENAAGAICGMIKDFEENSIRPEGIPVALSMLGTTTPGALRCKKILENRGFEVVTFHQNGTGGIAMEEMAAITSSEVGMAEVVYPIVPRAHIDAFRRRTLERSLETAGSYLGDGLKEACL